MTIWEATQDRCGCMQLKFINHRQWSAGLKTGISLPSGKMIKCYYGDQIKDDGIGVACNTFCRDEKRIQNTRPTT